MENTKGQGGQVILEAVLIAVLLLGCFMVVSEVFKESEYAQTLVGGPWDRLAGMIESGVWAPPQRARANGVHPNHQKRQLSYIGDEGN